jgi:hypothetical protein
MGVAAWLTPVLIVAVAAGLAHPAMGQPARPAAQATLDPPELIDPDCYPVEAEKADPLLVEEPDGVCPPDEPPPPGEGQAPEPSPAPDPGPGAQPGPAQESPSGAQEPTGGLASNGMAPSGDAAPPKSPARERPTGGNRRRPGLGDGQSGRPRRDPSGERESGRSRRNASGENDAGGPRRNGSGDGKAGSPRKDASGDGGAAAPQRSGRDRGAGGVHRGAREDDRPDRSRRIRSRRRASEGDRAHLHARSAPRRLHPPALVPVPLATQQALPEPLPRARRLEPRFARRLERVAERFRVPWGLMLAVRRARGHDGAVPASAARLRVLARRLVRLGARRNPRRAVRRLARQLPLRAESERPRSVRRHALVKRVVALAHLNRAIGLRGLVRGLNKVRARLARQVLDSRRLVIYAGGRADIGRGITEVRVLVLLRYLSSRYKEVTVSSLTSGHSFFTASGNVSAHSFGRAVDIAALNGRPILGNQEPGGLTERALRKILLLPPRLEPSQLISLFELGGPSFAMADHADHIHVGY